MLRNSCFWLVLYGFVILWAERNSYGIFAAEASISPKWDRSEAHGDPSEQHRPIVCRLNSALEPGSLQWAKLLQAEPRKCFVWATCTVSCAALVFAGWQLWCWALICCVYLYVYLDLDMLSHVVYSLTPCILQLQCHVERLELFLALCGRPHMERPSEASPESIFSFSVSLLAFVKSFVNSCKSRKDLILVVWVRFHISLSGPPFESWYVAKSLCK